VVVNGLSCSGADGAARVENYVGAARMEAKEHGPGNTPADSARVFERFVRAATGAGTHGLELGLPMVVEIARWHRGDAALEEAISGGALFRVTLPTSGGQAILPVRDRRDRPFSTGTS